MASSLNFSPNVKNLIPAEILEKLRIIPLEVKNDKLSIIARRPLSDAALIELKNITGIEDYELQLVGEDVLLAYLGRFKNGSIFEYSGV